MRVFKCTEKYDNLVLRIEKKALCNGAKVLYSLLAGANGQDMTVAYLCKVLQISENTYRKYINQLKKLNLIIIEKVGVNKYDCYIGTTSLSASYVKKTLDADDAESS
jgi:predicted AAA+ superfamily ATPase